MKMQSTGHALFSEHASPGNPGPSAQRGRRRRLATCCGLLVTTLLLWAAHGRAAPFLDYSISPAACTLTSANRLITQPDAPKPQLGVSYGRVGFAFQTTGILKLTCPIIGAELDGRQLRNIEMLYQDSSGSQDRRGWLSAKIYKVDAYEANLLETFSPVEALDSDSQTCRNSNPNNTQFGTCLNYLSGTRGFDFSRYYYYLEIELGRHDPSISVHIAGVRLNVDYVQ